jgi:hypothetical protein
VTLRRLALVVLLLVAGPVSTTAGELLRSLACADQVSHAESTSCPDPGDDGRPCGAACPCACCPGHSPPVAFVAVRPAVQPPRSDGLQPPLPDDPQPEDIAQRIFRPPRA